MRAACGECGDGEQPYGLKHPTSRPQRVKTYGDARILTDFLVGSNCLWLGKLFKLRFLSEEIARFPSAIFERLAVKNNANGLYYSLLPIYTTVYCLSLLQSIACLYYSLLAIYTTVYRLSILQSIGYLYYSLLPVYTTVYWLSILQSIASLYYSLLPVYTKQNGGAV
jgi:hypothetical protein